MIKQSLLRFAVAAHASPHVNASAWKQAVTNACPSAICWSDLYISTSATALTIGAVNPAGSEFLDANVAPMLGAVAQAAGQMLLIEATSLCPAFEFKGSAWQYSVPKLIVAKPSDKDWGAWKTDQLGDDQLDGLRDRICQDLLSQFKTWGLCTDANPPDLVVTITHVGRPMILKSAIHASPKPVSVLARLGVEFTCNVRFEGGFFVGALKGLGYGRIYRVGMNSVE